MKNKKLIPYVFVAALLVATIFNYYRSTRYVITKSRQDIYLNTIINIEIQHKASDIKLAKKTIQKAFLEIRKVNDLMSPVLTRSDIYKFNNLSKGDKILLSSWTHAVLRQSKEIYYKTDRVFDVTVKPVLDLWKSRARDFGKIPSDEDIMNALELVGFPLIDFNEGSFEVSKMKEGLTITLGGIAKGYAVDRAVDVIREAGFEHAIVDAGGDIFCVGKNPDGGPFSVYIVNPNKDKDNVDHAGVFSTSNMAVATSGDYERTIVIEGKKFHHIIDPRNGRPVPNYPSVTVVAPTCTLADAYATSLTVLGYEKGLELVESLDNIEAIFLERVDNDKLIPHVSSGLEGKVSFYIK